MMAFRAVSIAKYARIPTRSSRVRGLPLSSYLRPFSCTSTKSQQPYPLDSLIADAIQTENQLEANPPRKENDKGETSEQLSSQPEIRPIPPKELWSKTFPFVFEAKGRSFVMNPETAKIMAESCVPEGTKDQIILEAFPGPGTLTRALLDLPKNRIKKIIVMEDVDQYLQWLRPLEALDPRLTIIPASGYTWETYDHIFSQGLLDDVQLTDWSQEFSQLNFIAHVSDNVVGEQLVSQFFRCIPHRGWLFKYGRVPLNLFMTNTLWQRISDPPGTQNRCKLGVIAEGTASFDLTIPLPVLSPYRANFHPPGRGFREFVGVSIRPLKVPIIEGNIVEEWDYVLRRLFVQKATPIANIISSLAPGAASLLKKVAAESLPPDERFDTKLCARRMTAQQFKPLVEAFSDWPFKPEDLSIDNFQFKRSRQENRNAQRA